MLTSAASQVNELRIRASVAPQNRPADSTERNLAVAGGQLLLMKAQNLLLPQARPFLKSTVAWTYADDASLPGDDRALSAAATPVVRPPAFVLAPVPSIYHLTHALYLNACEHVHDL